MKIKTKRVRVIVRAMVALVSEILRGTRSEAQKIELVELKRTLLRLVTEQRKEQAL